MPSVIDSLPSGTIWQSARNLARSAPEDWRLANAAVPALEGKNGAGVALSVRVATDTGALSTDGGRVEIEWGFGEGAVAGKFFLRWSEKDGPPVPTPDSQGFGSKVIKRAFASVLGSDAVIEYRSKGLVCRFLAPADQVAGG